MAGPLDEAFVEITAELDTRQLQRAAKAASKAVANNLTAGVEAAEKTMAREGAKIGDALADGIGEGLEDGLSRDVNGKLRDSRGRFITEGNKIGIDTGRSIGSGLGGGFSEGVNDALSSIVNIKLPIPAFAALGVALASAAAAAVQFAAALAPAVGIVAALPSGIGVLAAGMSTLNVATLGVGEAFEAAATGSAEEFQSAIEDMPRAVQEAAQAIRDMMPALEELRNTVQDAFFQDFDTVLNSLAETLLGPVTTGMTAVAAEANGLITSLAGVATSAQGIEFVNQSFEIMAAILAQMREPLTALFGALLNVGVALNEAFGSTAGEGIAAVVSQFAEFLNQAAASGQAVAWVSDALDVFQAIGDILSPIIGIISSIGAAAQVTGGNILGVFGQALQVFDDFLASAQGQAALISIFEALNQVGAAFGEVLAGIAPAIPPLFRGLGDILSVVSPLLGPLSQLVGSVLTALAPILSVVAAAIQPLIAPLTTIITLLGEILVGALDAVMPLIEALANAMGSQLAVVLEVVAAVLQAVAPIFTVLFDAISPIIEALAPLYELFGVIAELIGAVLGPIIQVFGDILLWLVENVIVPYVIPIIELLINLLVTGLGATIQWVVEQFQKAGEGLAIVFEFIRDAGQAQVDAMMAAWRALSSAFQTAWAAINSRVFTPLKNGINTVKSVVSTALSNTQASWNTFVSFIKGIPGKISGALSNMFAPLATGFRSAINSVIRGWNNLSFSIPSVDIPGLGTVGGGTINTPNIPLLASGALATGPTLAMVGEGRFNEAILPLGDPRVDALLASALSRAGANNRDTRGSGDTINATGMSGDNYFTVKIGERELTDIVVEKQNEMNRNQLRRARAGTGRLA